MGQEKKWFAVVSRLMPKFGFLLAIALFAALVWGLFVDIPKTLIGIAIGLLVVVVLDVI